MIFSLKIEIIKLVRAETTLICNTLFEKPAETVGLRTNTGTKKSHRQGRTIVRHCFFEAKSQRVSEDSLHKK